MDGGESEGGATNVVTLTPTYLYGHHTHVFCCSWPGIHSSSMYSRWIMENWRPCQLQLGGGYWSLTLMIRPTKSHVSGVSLTLCRSFSRSHAQTDKSHAFQSAAPNCTL